MKIINIDLDYLGEDEVVIALGNFDGVHLGHRLLMKKAIETAKRLETKSCVLLFNEHTTATLFDKKKKELTSNEAKLMYLKKIGIDIVYLIDFNEEFMKMSPEVFVKNFLVKNLNVKGVVVGYDYRFGFKAIGDVETLREFCKTENLSLDVIDAYKIDGEVVSSTRIREAISDGRLEEANKLLGHTYFIKGVVDHGKKLGTKMGYPTANIITKDEIQLPGDGVYDTRIKVEGNETLYKAATSIGNNPTFSGESLKIEANILDFKEDIYGKKVYLYFIKKLRPMLVFDSVEELFDRIAKDVEEVRKSK